MKKINKLGLVILCATALFTNTYAQNTVISGGMSVFGPFGATNFSQNTYLGGITGSSVLEISGSGADFRQAGQNFAIIKTGPSAASQISVSSNGRFIFDKPSDYFIDGTPLSWTTQNFDGGFSSSMLGYSSVYGDGKLVNRNPNNVNLTNLDVTVAGYPADTKADVMFTIGVTEFALTDGAGNAITGNDFILNDNHYIHYPSGTPNVITNYRQSRFFVTNGTGHLGILMGDPITLGLSGYGIQNFPVGVAEGDYTPAKVSISSGLYGDFTMVNVKTYANPETIEPLPAEGIDRVWNMYRLNFSGSTNTAQLAIDLQHNDVTSGSLYTYPNAFVTRYSGTAPNTDGGATSTTVWDYTGTCNIESGNGTLTTDATMATATELTRTFPTNSFATLPTDNIAWYTKSVCDASPLPVSLTSFFVKELNCIPIVYWTTAIEQNASHYDILRKDGSNDFKVIGSVNAAGNSNTPLDYSYTDNNPLVNNEIYTYKLKMVDLDGKFKFSEEDEVHFDCDIKDQSITVYPNPSNGHDIRIDMNHIPLENNISIKLYNTIGQIVYSYQLTKEDEENYSYTLPVSQYAKGIYHLVLVGDNTLNKSIKIAIK